MTKASKLFAGKIKDRLAKKQDETQRQPGVLGDANGVVIVPGLMSFNYVMVGDKTLPVFNNRVPAQAGIKVWVGYEPDKNDKKYRNKLFQVLSTRSETPSGVETGYVGYAPARRYEWNATNGGQDPLTVHLRAFSPLRLGVSSAGGMNVELYSGEPNNGTNYYYITRQNIDLTAHIPTTAGKAALVMISIDNTGAVIQTKGSEVDITALVRSDRPAIPANTIFVCGCVRVYYGQTKVQEGRINTDFDDLRFPGLFSVGGGGGYTPPATTALNDVQVGDGAGAWIKKTLAEFVTILRTALDTVYQAVGAYLTEAPVDGSPYARQDAGWVAASNGISVETEIDFGTANIIEKTFIITDANVSAVSEINVYVKGKDPSDGRSKDETTSEFFQFSCIAGAGTFDLKAISLNGTVNGKFVLGYFAG